MGLEPDPGWENIIGGVTPAGLPRPMSVEVLQELTGEWSTIVDSITPFGGTELLRAARSLVVQSWFDYELLSHACLVSLQGVEATFRQVAYPECRPKAPLSQLVRRAEGDGLFTEQAADVIRSGVQLRNRLSHPDRQRCFGLGMAAPIVRTSHLVVRDICSVKGLMAE